MKPKVYWFRYNHENRNDLLRFGFMQLDDKGYINYIEKPLIEASKFGFSPEVSQGIHRHISFIVVDLGTLKKIIVDSEDSFVFTSELIAECDYYFSSGYNSDFFINKKVLKKYDWQSLDDISWYNQTISDKIKDLGMHFHKARKFIPIAPNLSNEVYRSYTNQKVINFKSKLLKLLKNNNYWKPDFENYKKRYKYLLSLRTSKLTYDITLNDSLWGWPKHRILLHKKLADLNNNGYKINSILNWSEPNVADNSINEFLDKTQFPIKIGEEINNYELMISKSKIGVFATGFHFGWRNIMTLSLMIGLPVLVDKLKLEPYFEMNDFKYYENEDHEWNTILPTLTSIEENKWESIKENNQAYYDKVMSPEAVANYFLSTVMNT